MDYEYTLGTPRRVSFPRDVPRWQVRATDDLHEASVKKVWVSRGPEKAQTFSATDTLIDDLAWIARVEQGLIEVHFEAQVATPALVVSLYWRLTLDSSTTLGDHPAPTRRGHIVAGQTFITSRDIIPVSDGPHRIQVYIRGEADYPSLLARSATLIVKQL